MALNFLNIESRQPTQLQITAAYRTFRASSGSIAAPGTSEFPLMLLSNPSLSVIPLSVLLKKIICLTVSESAIFKFYLNPTILTNGTAVVPVNLRLNPAAPASGMLAYKNPTVSANGTEFSAATAQNLDVFLSAPAMLDPGNSILVTATATNTGALCLAELMYGEGV